MKDISLILKDILTPFWFNELKDIIMSDDNYEYFFSDKDKFFPDLKNRFNAVNDINFKKNEVKTVIFGQDPYPRKESATGYAFWDGKIKSWENPLSPSFRNIIKSVLINKGLASENDKIKEIRKVIKENNIFTPDDFFKNSIYNGVVWLNASLTFESKKQTDLNNHLKFWKPVIEKIIVTILKNSKSVIFVFWGNKSLKFQKSIRDTEYHNYFFIKNCHPMLEQFHNKNTFSEIDKIYLDLNKNTLNWLNI